MFDQTDITTLRSQIASGETSAVAVAQHALRRIAAIDRAGLHLNSVVVLNPRLISDAAQLDAERAAGQPTGRLHGIPFTVKDSFAVGGLTAAAGSPAFAALRASTDAVVVERLRAAGAMIVGKTNMPPMAIGGGQAGLYGRTRSPYNPEYLAAAWHSGSSIGSAVSVAAGLCSFGIGEETVSSGRSPASNNALVAYTPSWGVVPSAGNWPLHPYRDVVVPHTRSVADLTELLAVIAGPDDRDVWMRQDAIDVSRATIVADELTTTPPAALPLAGLTVGVPRLYVGESYDDVVAIPIRPSILELWNRAEAALVAAGATVVHVPFPLVEAYEQRSAAASTLEKSGYLPEDWTAFELGGLLTTSWTRFLAEYATDAPALSRIAPSAVRPDPPFAVDAVENGQIHPGRDVFDFTAVLRTPPTSDADTSAAVAAALTGLTAAREELFEAWLTELGIDMLAFPANSDIGPWDADVNPSSAHIAWADGAVFSTMNHVMRRVGIPSVTVPMGLTKDIGMPVGLTICGPAYSDARLVAYAATLEQILPARASAVVPPVAAIGLFADAEVPATPPAAGTEAPASASVRGIAVIQPLGGVSVRVECTVTGGSSAVLEAGGRSWPVGQGETATEFTLDPAVRTVDGDIAVLALLTVIGASGLVTAAAFSSIPFHRFDPLAALRSTSTPSTKE